LSNPVITRGDAQAVMQAMRVAGSGDAVFPSSLESLVAEAAGRTYGIALASSEQALPTLLHAAGVSPGREVILPALGEPACLRALARLGLTPRFAECDPGTLLPTTEALADALTSDTAAVIMPHGDGWGSTLPDIATACAQKEVPLIEYVGTRIGSRCGGGPAGSLGRAAVLDFSRRSVVSGGEGAVIVTDDRSLADRCRPATYAQCRSPQRADAMPPLAAALALAQMKRLPTIAQACAAAAEQYTIGLAAMPELLLPAITTDTSSSWSRYIVRLDETFASSDRDEIIRGMQRHDIHAAAGLHHLPTAWDPACSESCPVAASVAGRAIALPMHPDLTRRDVDLICQTLQLMVQRATFRRAS
jgi:dTDP-4-amino-4,6-dideoxygalactose transaminase